MSYCSRWLTTGLSQEENVKRIKKSAHKKGWSYRTKKLSDGSVKMTLRKKD